jgi:LmbE family N-acetylglucosaminyl deacetylase
MRVLAIGAHADDIEIGCGGTLLGLQRRGVEAMKLVVVSDSAYGDPRGHRRTAEDAAAEAAETAARLGASLEIFGLPTLALRSGQEMIERLRDAIEAFQPDRVFTNFIGDGHLDHAAVGESTLVACRHRSVLMYRVNLNYTPVPFDGAVLSDISEDLEAKIALVRTYRSESKNFQLWEDFMRAQSRIDGLRAGCAHAEAFHCARWIL